MSPLHFNVDAIRGFAASALSKAGLDADKAETVARLLVEGDLMGHTTHGLQLLLPYVRALESGGMKATGSYEIVRDRQAAALWDGGFLPGPWLITEGFRLGIARARDFGTFTLVIRRSHHTACLAAFVDEVAQAGFVGLLTCSDPTVACVAPFGGTEPLYSPNPYAAGFPTAGGNVLVDVSLSQTTNGLTQRLYENGELFENEWLLDAEGMPSHDPAVRFTDPPGTLLPLGGLDTGHKGYGLGLMVEALTNGLAGYGRADGAEGWQASVFLQVIDPAFFGGQDAFLRETGWMVESARANRPRDPRHPVRIPGERGHAKRAQMLKSGVELSPGIYAELRAVSERCGLTLPDPLD